MAGEKEYRQTISFQTTGTGDVQKLNEEIARLKKSAEEFNKQGGLSKQFEKSVRVTDRIATSINKEGQLVAKLTRSFSDNTKAEERAAKQQERARAKKMREEAQAARQKEKDRAKEARQIENVRKEEEKLEAKRTKARRDELNTQQRQEASAARASAREEARQKKQEQYLRRRGVQGFFQGLSLPGLQSYITAKPGMGRYAAGYVAGRALRTAGAVVGGGLVSGFEGVQQAINGIPLAGPGLAALMGMQRQAGEAARDFGIAGSPLLQLGGPGILQQRAAPTGRNVMLAAESGGTPIGPGERATMAIQQLQDELGIVGMAQRFGITPQKAQQIAVQGLGVSGLETDEGHPTARAMRVTREAIEFSARGLNPQFAGIGGKAQRLGLLSPEVGADKIRANVLAEAQAAGLDRADVPQLLEKIFRQLEQATELGMRPDLRLQTGAAMGLAGLGVGPAGSQALAGMFGGAGRSMAQGGPQGLDWLMMSAFGFAKPGLPGQMSPEDLLNARLAMERGTFMSDPMRFIKGLKFMAGATPGNPAAAAGVITSSLRNRGQNVPVELEKELAEALASPDQMNADRLNAIAAKLAKLREAEPGAEQFVPREAARAAGIEAQRIQAGRPMVDTLQTFEETTMNTLKTATDTFAASLNELSQALKSISKDLAERSKPRMGVSEAFNQWWENSFWHRGDFSGATEGGAEPAAP